jgi:iron(III) transport system ATP-binding protein
LTVAENVAFPLIVKGERDVAAAVAWATRRVVGGMYLGPHVEYIVEVGADRLRAYSRTALAPGSPAILTFDARDCRLVDDTSQMEARSHRA